MYDAHVRATYAELFKAAEPRVAVKLAAAIQAALTGRLPKEG